MTFVQPDIVLQTTIALQGAFMLIGLVIAFTGRLIHDALIYLGGFLSGLWGGTVFLLPAYSGSSFAVSQNALLSGAIGIGIVILSGIVGSYLAWHAYVVSVQSIGAIVGFVFTTTALNLGFLEALEGIMSLSFMFAISFTGVVCGIVFLLFGVLLFAVSYANLTDNLEMLETWANLWNDSLDTYENSTIQAILMIPFGLFFIVLQAAAWLFPYPRELILWALTYPLTSEMNILPYTLVFVGVFVGVIVIWKLHRIFLIVETALLGGFLVAVSGTANQFLSALVELDIKTAVQLVDVFSIMFVLVSLLGILVQSGMLAVVDAEEAPS